MLDPDDRQKERDSTPLAFVTTEVPVRDTSGLIPQDRLDALLEKHIHVFDEPQGLPPDRGVDHVIKLIPGSHAPFRRLGRLSKPQEEEVRTQVTMMIAKGWIEPSNSPYGAPPLFIAKKDGTMRMVIDYRALNKITIRDRFPLPRIDDMLDRLKGCTVFSALDMTYGYHQVRIPSEDAQKTGFMTPMGVYHFRVLSLGLCNAPSTFQRMVAKVFGKHMMYGGDGTVEDQKNGFIICYLDDILIASRNAADYYKHIKFVLETLAKHKLYAKRKKCEFNMPNLKWLGFIVGRDGRRADPAKIEAIVNYPRPKTLTQLKGFLGMAVQLRIFIEHFSSIVAPLTDLTSLASAQSFDLENWTPRPSQLLKKSSES